MSNFFLPPVYKSLFSSYPYPYLLTSDFLKNLFIYLYVYKYFACMYVFALYTCLVCGSRGHWIPWNCIYRRWLWPTMWVLEPRSSARAARVPNCWAISLTSKTSLSLSLESLPGTVLSTVPMDHPPHFKLIAFFSLWLLPVCVLYIQI